MALSYNSETFRNAKQSLVDLGNEKGKLTQDDVKAVADSFGISVEDFKEANKELKLFKQKGLSTEAGIGAMPARVVGRAVGYTAEGLGRFAKALTPDPVENAISNVADKVGEYIPDSVKKAAQATFDPYHGEGLASDIEETAGIILSYAAPAKILTTAGKTALSSGTVAPHVARTMSRLGSKSQKTIKGGAYGVSFAGATTLLDDPRENIIDIISAFLFDNPEALARLEALENNPDDPEALDYLNAFIRNAGFEGAIGAAGFGVGSLGKALLQNYKAGKYAKTKRVITKLGQGTQAAKNFLKQYGTSRMGTDDATLAGMVKLDRAAEAAMLRADGIAKDFDKLVQSELGDQIAANPNYLEEVIDKAMKGDAAAFERLITDSPEVAGAVQQLRKEIDELSKKLLKRGAKGKLKATIDKNLNVYMNRSYEIFDNPEYMKQIQERVLVRKDRIPEIRDIDNRVARNEITPEEATILKQELSDDIVDNAARFIARQSGKTVDDPYVQETLEKLVKTEDKEVFGDFISDVFKNQQPLTGKPLLKRKKIDRSIRDLWGEVKDPTKNFVKTYEKLSVLDAENEFLEGLAERLNSKFLKRVNDIKQANPQLTNSQAIAEAKKGLVDIGSVAASKLDSVMGRGLLKANQIENALQGVYADPAYEKAVRNGLDVYLGFQNKYLDGALKTWMAAKGGQQALKTVYNPTTHGRNIMGNMIMLTANGMVPNKKSLYSALKTTGSRLAGKNNKELGEQMARYAELGITNSGIGLGTVRANFNNAIKNPEKWLDNAVTSKVKKVADVYQAEDDFFKIIHFEKTKDMLKKAYPQMDNIQIEEMAAQRTRDLMPNYSLVPKAIKSLRAMPVGDFVSFPAEMVRTTKNLAKYAIKDLGDAAQFGGINNSGNYVNTSPLWKSGLTKLAGMTAVGTGGEALRRGTMNYFGISEEQDRAINMLDAPYNMFQERIYLSPINVDKNNHVGVDNINLGPIDPYSYLKTFGRAVHASILSGEPLTDFEREKIAAGMIQQQLAPFIAPSMLTEGIADLISGKPFTYDDSPEEFARTLMDYTLDLADPGWGRFIEKYQNYKNSGMTKSYNTINPGDVDLPAFLGVRRQRTDLSNAVRFNLNPKFAEIDQASRRMKRFLDNPNLTDPDEIYEEYKDSQKSRLDSFKDLRSMIELYKDIGYSSEDIINDLTMFGARGKSSPEAYSYLQAAEENYFLPSILPETTQTLVNQTPIPYDRIYDLYSKLSGAQLEKESR
jgi:hypothetical protein